MAKQKVDELGDVAEITVLPPEIEEKVNREISTAIAEVNYTDVFITKMKEEFLPMTINGQQDKEGYLNLQTVRKQVKQARILVQKTFKKGREIAKLEVQKWIDKEKEIVGEIQSVEKTLEAREEEWEKERDRIKEEQRQRIEQQGVARITDMVGFGAKLVGSNWVLNDVVYESQLIKEADPEIYQSMKDEFEAQYKINEKVRLEQLEQQRLQNERMEQQRQQLADQQAEIDRQRREIREGLIARRKNQLLELGFTLDKAATTFSAYNEHRHISVIENSLEQPQAQWDAYLEVTTKALQIAKEAAERQQAEDDAAAEQKRQEGLENARKEAVGSTRRKMLGTVKYTYPGTDMQLGALEEQAFTDLFAQAKIVFDDEVEAERLRIKTEEDAQKGDKERWADWLQLLKDNPVPVLRSAKYAAKGRVAKGKITEIQAL